MLVLRSVIFLLPCFITLGLCQDEDKNKDSIRDITYELEAGRLYRKQIGDKGPSLIVGSRYLEVVPKTNKTTVMTCELSTNREDYHHETYKTQISMQINEHGEINEFDKNDFHKYFFVTKKEVWSCSGADNVGMSRIVNELVGSEEISQILFHDGMEVTSKSLLHGRRTAVIKEIKYIDQYSGTVWRYDGFLKLNKKSVSADDEIPDLKKNFRLVKRVITGDNFKEVFWNTANSATPLKTVINKKAKLGHLNLMVESLPTESYGTEATIAECTKDQGTYTYPFSLRPQINVIEVSGKTKVTENNFLKYFTPIREERWICKDDTGKQFWRFIYELVSKMGVMEIEHFDDLTELREIKLSGVAHGCIRATFIHYAHFDNPFKRIKYVGNIKLITPERQDIVLMKGSIYRTGVELREIDYVLQPGRIYRSSISSKGFNIRVGSAWTKTIGNKDDIVICTLQVRDNDYSFDYGTKFRLRLRTHSKEYMKAIPRSKHSEYWSFTKQTIWLCRCQDEKFKFLRIVNELKGLTELREVEYYDSIQLYSRLLDGSKSSVNLVEVKYVDHNSYDIIKYEGQLKLQTPSGSFYYFNDCLNCDGQLITKTENEIFYESDSGKNVFSYHHLVEGTSYVHNTWLEYESSKPPTISLLFSLGINMIGEIPGYDGKGLAMCKVTDKRMDSFNIRLLIWKRKWVSMSNDENENHLNILGQNVWECEINQELKFFRIVNNFEIKGAFTKLFYRIGVTISAGAGDNTNFEEIKYTNSTGGNVKFEGIMELVPEPDELYDKVISGTIIMTDRLYFDSVATEYYSDGLHTIYDLDFEKHHQFTLGHSGRTVGIGNKWPTANAATVQSVQCERDTAISREEFIRDYRTECRFLLESGGSSAMSRDKSICFDTYFTLVHWEVWICKDKNDIVFKRVVNSFELKLLDSKSKVEPIKEIRYFDGLFIGLGHYANGVQGWAFKEVKYVSHDNPLELFKYTGELTLNLNDIESRNINDLQATDMSSCLFNIAGRLMKYQIHDDKMVYRTIMNPSGLMLKINTRYEKPSTAGNLLCKSLSQTHEKYQMKVFLGEKSGNLFNYNEIKTADYISRFSQSWSCTLPEDVSSDKIQLIRVVNRVRVSKAVSQVIHYDGVTVKNVPPDESVIEETKYIDPSDDKVTKYDGFVVLTSIDEVTLIKSPMENREIDYILDKEMLHVRRYKDSGLVMECGTKWKKVFANRYHRINCDSSKPLTYDDKYLFEIFTVSTVKSKLSKAQQDAIFNIITREALNCRSAKYGNITRVVNIIETKNMDVAEIYHTDGVTIWKNKKSGAESIIIREVKFLDKINNEALKFEGEVAYVKSSSIDRFSEGTSVEETGAISFNQYYKQMEKQNWYIDKKEWEQKHAGYGPLENIVFTERDEYSTIIQAFVGLNIEVGSKWTKIIGSFDDKFTCEVDTGKYDLKLLMPSIAIDFGSNKLQLDEETLTDYFKIEKTEIYKCSDQNQGSESFLRVVTELCGKTGIRRVKFHNGVKIIRQPIGFSENTAYIIEHKYLDPTDFSVIKYTGKLEKM